MGKIEKADDRLNRRGIGSVEIGLRLIEALREAGAPQSLSELSRATGMAASNCHRYVVSFMRAGFIIQDESTKRYRFGARALQAGLAALAQLDVIAIGTEALTRLVDDTGYTGLLAIWSDSGPVIIRWMPGHLAVRTTLSAGSTLPLLRSATGRVFLAFLPARQTAAFLEGAKREANEDPLKLVKDVKAAGLSQVAGNYIPGLSAVAAPILDMNGDAAAVLTLVGLSDGFSRPAVRQLKEIAKAASTEMGWGNKPSS